jgi:flagellar biosynthesis protein FlhA
LRSNHRFLGIIPGYAESGLPAGLPHLAWPWPGRWRSASSKSSATPVKVAPATVQEAMEASWSDVAPLDVLGLEVGYRLIPLVDKSQDGELLRRIRGIRKKFAQEVGFLVSPVHIRDNLELKPNAYRILLKGVEVGEVKPLPGSSWRSILGGLPVR